MNRTNRATSLNSMKRITSVMAMHARDRGIWFSGPWIIAGLAFAICLLIAFSIAVLFKGTPGVWTGAQAGFFIVMLIGGTTTVGGTFPFAVGFGTRRKDYVLGTVAMAVAVSAVWAIPLVVLSVVEASVIKNWGVGLHFFHLPFFSDGALVRQFCWTPNDCAQSDPNYFRGAAPLQQYWFSFALLLVMCLLGLLLGSIYQRLGRVGVYGLFGIVFLLISLFVLLSSYWGWWGSILGWFAQQSAASLAVWLVPLMAVCALATYALLRKATA